MSEFTSSFWDVYIGLATLLSLIACALFLKSQSRRRPAGSARTTGHVWDEDLGEYNNPLPAWWRWLFFLTIAFGFAYLVLYPGLGSYAGLWGWSQDGQLKEEIARADERYGPIFDRFAAQDIPTLARDPAALAIGQKLFLNHCAQCHASDGGGSRGFPNLADRDWLYGGEPELIEASIAQGRNGVMPPLGPVLGEQGAKDVAHYVLSLSGTAHDSLRRVRGEALFKVNCVACHGAEGKGNPLLGAPNLTDRIWLHGSGEPAIMETVMKGRNSRMPAQEGLLTPAKIHLLTSYVYSLSGGTK